MAGIVVRLLGEVEVERDGEALRLAPAERALVAELAAAAPRSVALEALEAALWPGHPPASARASLHNHLSRLRSKLGPEGLERHHDHYRLGPDVTVDLHVLQRALHDGERALTEGHPREALAHAEEGLALLGSAQPLPARDGRAEVDLSVRQLEASALLALGRAATAVDRLEALVVADPLREQAWAELVEALRAAGRRSEAVRVFRRARAHLVAETGLEPGEQLVGAISAL